MELTKKAQELLDAFNKLDDGFAKLQRQRHQAALEFLAEVSKQKDYVKSKEFVNKYRSTFVQDFSTAESEFIDFTKPESDIFIGFENDTVQEIIERLSCYCYVDSDFEFAIRKGVRKILSFRMWS